jgi:hypothetical protein
MKSVFNKLKENRPDPTLKWSLGYDFVYSTLIDSNNPLADNKELSKNLYQVSREAGDHLSWNTYSFYGKGSVLEYLIGILKVNSADLKEILIKNYYNGFVCQIPIDQDQNRTIICLSTKI